MSLDQILLKLRHYHSALGLRGVVLFLYSKATGLKPIVKVKLSELAYPVFLRIGTTDISTFRQVLVERHYDFNRPESAKFIVDAGANIGLSAIYFANRFPEALIVVIEPETSNFEMLRRNVANYPRISAIKGALWRENEDILLLDSGQGNHGFQVDSRTEKGASNLGWVRGYTVDQIMRDAGQETIDLLKLDIEGSERDVLSACDSWIDHIQVMMIELHDHLKPGCSDAFHQATRGFSPDEVKGETTMRYVMGH